MALITLTKNSKSIQHLIKNDKRLASVIDIIGDLSYEPHSDPYAFLVHEIIEQMLSIKVSAKIYSRLEILCGGKISINAIDALTDEQIKTIGTSAPKVNYLRSLTSAVKTGLLDFHLLSTLPDQEVLTTLTSIRGIGTWTAKMYLIFVLNRQDILPYEDGAFLQAYEWLYKRKDHTKSTVEKKCAKWKPYSSIAARYLYRALDSGLTKQIPYSELLKPN